MSIAIALNQLNQSLSSVGMHGHWQRMSRQPAPNETVARRLGVDGLRYATLLFNRSDAIRGAFRTLDLAHGTQFCRPGPSPLDGLTTLWGLEVTSNIGLRSPTLPRSDVYKTAAFGAAIAGVALGASLVVPAILSGGLMVAGKACLLGMVVGAALSLTSTIGLAATSLLLPNPDSVAWTQGLVNLGGGVSVFAKAVLWSFLIAHSTFEQLFKPANQFGGARM